MKSLPKVFFFPFFAFLFFLLFSPTYAQTQDFQSYCREIEHYPPLKKAPDDFEAPVFVEPNWGELDKTRFETTVYQPITINDQTDGTGNFGGTLSISNLSLPYVKEIADYLEGPFLDENHRKADFRTLTSADFLNYNGPVVKLTPQRIQDRLKKNYIWALVELGKRSSEPHKDTYKTPDINLLYWDVCGQNPRTIYDLVKNWGYPEPPSLKDNPTENDWKNWRETWARYWPKIPLHDPGSQWSCDPTKDQACQAKFPEWDFNQPPNMRSQGCLVVKPDAQVASEFDHENTCLKLNDQELSGSSGLQVVRLGVPDVLRLDTLSRFVQQIISPQLVIELYYCKFLGRADFCENKKGTVGACGTSNEASFEKSLKSPSRLGDCGPNDGEVGTGGNPIYLYDKKGNKVNSVTLNLTSTGPPNQNMTKNFGFASKFPYLGLIFGKLTSSLTGAFKYFDPQGILKDPVKYQENSTQIPASISFSDTTAPTGGTANNNTLKIWAGFLSGIRNSKNFVIDTLLPQSLKK